MKRHTRLAVAWLLALVVLAVASCGASGGGAEDDAGESGGKGGAKTNEMRNTDQSSDGRASGMLMQDGRYSDRLFIDAMVPHHQGAVEMAEVALDKAEHQEVRDLSKNVVSTQEAEIKELKAIKQDSFGTSRVPMDMNAGQMAGMGMTTDARSLAKEKPFDEAFIGAMIPHHRSAVEMAEVAQEKSENPRIKELSGNIIRAQEREISQMRTWRESWYPKDRKGADDAR